MTRVLIVDDHEDNLTLLRANLEFHGFQVDAARHGAEALLKARREPPQLVISDLLMPVMDGFTLLRQWKADQQLRQIPFVVYTATYTDPRDQQLADDLGVDAFILKPTAREAFMARIEAVLARQEQGELVPAVPPPVSEPILLKEYNEVLVRKLEAKTVELERTNRALQDDIARRVEAETALRLFIEFAPAAIVMFDREMRYMVVSRRWMTDYGIAEPDITGRSHYDVFPDLPQRWKEVHRRCLAGATERADEDPFPRADGSLDWVRWEMRPWRTADGTIGGIILFSEVITERKEAEQALRASEARYRTLIEQAADGILISGPDGSMQQVNARACELFGYTPEEFVGLPLREIVAAFEVEKQAESLRQLWAGERIIAVRQFRRKDGSLFPGELSACKMEGGQGLGLVRDITQRRQTEQALNDSRARLEALTRRLLEVQEAERRLVASELHDEVGGALTAVKLNLQALRREHTEEQREAALADGLALVDGAIQSVRSLSLDLRPAVLDDLGLIPALKWYGERQARRAGMTIELVLEAIDLRGAPQLETACFRIVQEAVNNALRHGGAQRIQVTLRRHDGRFLIEIADDGSGFDLAAARRRGLAGESGGLLGMEERAELLGGRLEIESTPGGGTRVGVEFALPEEGFA